MALLCKEVCQSCMRMTGCWTGFVKNGKHVLREPIPWFSDDDKLWKKGRVQCPNMRLGSTFHSEALKRCPYALEHLMKCL